MFFFLLTRRAPRSVSAWLAWPFFALCTLVLNLVRPSAPLPYGSIDRTDALTGGLRSGVDEPAARRVRRGGVQLQRHDEGGGEGGAAALEGLSLI
jgi:hypothetical protein